MEPVYVFIVIMVASLAASTALYLFLRRKTKIGTRYLYTDNPAVAVISALAVFVLHRLHLADHWMPVGLLLICTVLFLAFVLTMVRFWRVPRRRVTAGLGQVVSPADGRVIYIKKITGGEIPESVKGKITSRLEELTKTQLLNDGGWHIGINMTPFDVHKNCAPVSGKIILNQHFKGRFLSLKDPSARNENERNTYVLVNDEVKIGVVQIASRLVRRIDSYVKEGENVSQGDWIGMIRFGSQVDVIIPGNYRIMVNTGRQIHAAETIIAEKNADTD